MAEAIAPALASAGRFDSFEALRAAHAALLDSLPDELGAHDLARLTSFIAQATATGAVLIPEDRQQAQGLIDYWTASLLTEYRELSAKSTTTSTTRVRPPTTLLAEFNADYARNVAEHAAQWFREAENDDRELARRLFLRLVQLSSTTRTFKLQSTSRSNLWGAGPPAKVDAVIQALADAGVLKITKTTDQPDDDRVELISEALTRTWNELEKWLEQRLRFRAAAELWSLNRRKEDCVGEQSIAEAEDFHDRNATENEFLKASLAEVTRQRDEKLRQLEDRNNLLGERDRARERALRRAEQRLWLAILFSVCLVLLLVAMQVAYVAVKSAATEAENKA